MDRKTLLIAVFSITAVVLMGLNLSGSSTSANANVSVAGRRYKAVTAHIQRGGDVLYLYDEKSGEMAVVAYNPNTRQLDVLNRRPLIDAFTGR